MKILDPLYGEGEELRASLAVSRHHRQTVLGMGLAIWVPLTVALGALSVSVEVIRPLVYVLVAGTVLMPVLLTMWAREDRRRAAGLPQVPVVTEDPSDTKAERAGGQRGDDPLASARAARDARVGLGTSTGRGSGR